MLIFLYGPDTYRSRRKLNEIIGQYQEIHKSGLNLRVLDCLIADFQDFKNELRAVSMFEGKKLIILKNVFASPQFNESLAQELPLESKNTLVIFEEGDLKSAGSPLFSLLIKHAKTQKFELLSGLKLEAWAKQEFQKYNSKIGPEALRELIIYCGNDLWRLSNEIGKLSSYAKEVGLNDVRSLVRSELGANIFETIDAVASGNKKLALALLRKQLAEGEAPLYLLSMINFQFRNILLVKDLVDKGTPYPSLAGKTGLRPFVIGKTAALCRRFALSQIKKIYQMIFQIDLDIKSGKIEAEAALDLFVAEL